MTTIAYRAGVLCADSQINTNLTRAGWMHKIGKTANGYLWGHCGDAHLQEAFARWCETREGDAPKQAPDENTSILISPDGTVREWFGNGWCQFDAPYRAWGSGGEFAIGAMAMGASARRAVEIAMQFDHATGGALTVLSLHEPEQAVPAEPAVLQTADVSSDPNEFDGLKMPPFDPADYSAWERGEKPETWRQKRNL